jgi:hypothetical protein
LAFSLLPPLEKKFFQTAYDMLNLLCFPQKNEGQKKNNPFGDKGNVPRVINVRKNKNN